MKLNLSPNRWSSRYLRWLPDRTPPWTPGAWLMRAWSRRAWTPEGASGPFGAGTAEEADVADLDPAEMARQLANLSLKAAKAVAAAAKASTDAERDAALAAVEAEDDTVNRGLLLKFLGSVDG